MKLQQITALPLLATLLAAPSVHAKDLLAGRFYCAANNGTAYAPETPIDLANYELTPDEFGAQRIFVTTSEPEHPVLVITKGSNELLLPYKLTFGTLGQINLSPLDNVKRKAPLYFRCFVRESSRDDAIRASQRAHQRHQERQRDAQAPCHRSSKTPRVYAGDCTTGMAHSPSRTLRYERCGGDESFPQR